MKKMKKWLALILAIVLVASNAIYSMGSALQADEIEMQESVPTEQPAEVVNEAEGLDVDVVNEPQPAPEPVVTPTPEPVVEQPVETPTPEPVVEEPQPEEVKYNVIIQKSDVDGGAIKSWTTGDKVDVTYDGNNQYKEELVEGTPFNFEITAKEDYEVEKVTDQNGAEIASTAVNGKVYTYQLPSVTEEKSVSILYKEIEKKETKVEEAKVEEKDEGKKPSANKATRSKANIITIKLWTNDNERLNVPETLYEECKGGEWKIISGKDKIHLNNTSNGRWNIGAQVKGLMPTRETPAVVRYEYGDGKYLEYFINVESPLTITGPSHEMTMNSEPMKLTITNTSGSKVQWHSNDKKIAEVDDEGKVTAKDQGKVVIRAKAGKLMDVWEITVGESDDDDDSDDNDSDDDDLDDFQGKYTVSYQMEESLRGNYVYNNGSAKDPVQEKSERFNYSFNVFLKQQQTNIFVKAVEMVLLNDVEGRVVRNQTEIKETPIEFKAGDVISALDDAGNAKAIGAFANAQFTKGTEVRIEVRAVKHQVTFVGDGGKVVDTQTVVDGTSATAPDEDKLKVAHKEFTGWDKEFSKVKSDLTVKAQYEDTKYKVNYYLDKDLQDDFVLSKNNATQWTDVKKTSDRITGFGVVLHKRGTENRVEALSMIMKDTVHGKTDKGVPVTIEEGKVVSVLNKGQASVVFLDGNLGHTYFDKDTEVNIIVTAVTHNVDFYGEDGKLIEHQAVLHGESAIAPNAEKLAVEHKKFTGWDVDFSNVTGDLKVTAQYEWTDLSVNYYLDESLKGTYTLKNNGQDIYTEWKTAPNKVVAFGVWLKRTSDGSTADRRVVMVMRDTVTGKNGNGSTATIQAGTVVSKLDGQDAKVVYASGNLGGVHFEAGTQVNIMVTAAPPEKIESEIHFETNGGTAVEAIKGYAKESTGLSAWPKTTMTGYDLEGWYADKGLTQKVESHPETFPDKATTYFAKWQRAISDNTFGITGFDTVYDGEPHTVTFTGETSLLDGETVEYSTNGTDGWSAEKPSYTNVTETTVYARVVTGEDVLWSDSANVKISPLAMSVKADNLSKTYKDEDPDLTVTINGEEPSEELLEEFGVKVSRAEGEDVTVEGYEIEVTTTDNPNYAIETVNGTFTINKRPLTITVDSYEKVYREDDPKFEGKLEGWKEEKALEYTLERSDKSANVGEYDIDTVTVSSENKNYEYPTIKEGAKLTISSKEVTLVPISVSKVYGDDDPTFDFEVRDSKGDVDTKARKELNYSVAPTAKDDDKEVKNAGTYALRVTETSENNNYKVTVNKDESTFVIRKRPVTLTVAHAEKLFGTADKDANFSANVTEGTVVAGETLDYSVERTEKNQGEDVGKYFLDVVFDAENNPNYEITSRAGQLEILPAEIEVLITADGAGKTYGEKDPKLTATVTGVEHDKIDYSVARVKGENAGTYDIEVKLGKNPNYNVDKIKVVKGTFTVSPKSVEITVGDAEKTYGDKDPVKDYTATAKGLIEGDEELTYTFSRVPGDNAGKYAITAALDESVKNYVIESIESVETGTLTINPKEVTVTAASVSKTYGEMDPTFTATVKGLLEGEKDSLSYSLSREDASNQNVGKYNIKIDEVTQPLSNYKIERKTGTLTIEQAAATIIAEGASKTYGDADPEKLSATVSGLVNGDEILDYSVIREDGEQVKADGYKISIKLEEKANQNYDIKTENDVFTINKKDIKVTANPQTKTYGGADPEKLTATVDEAALVGDDKAEDIKYSVKRANDGENVADKHEINVIPKENDNYTVKPVASTLEISKKDINVTANPQTKTYGDADPEELTATVDAAALVGDDKAEDINYSVERADDGENVADTHVINVIPEDNDNYTVVPMASTFTIHKKAVTVTPVAATKVYGAPENPALDVTVDGAEKEDLNLTISRDDSDNEDVGTYPILVTETDNPNYDITVVDGGAFTITPKPITITPVAGGKTYGDAEPALETVLSENALVGEDTLTYEAVRAEGEAAGTYELSIEYAANKNYAITTGTADFTINKKAITLKAADTSVTYGETTPTFGVEAIEGIDMGELSYTVAPVGTENPKNAGTYKLEVKQEAGANPNYDITPDTGSFTINKRPVTLKAADITMMYGGEEPDYTASVTKGTVVGEDVLDYTMNRVEGTDADKYDITVVPGTNPNYDITTVGGQLTIAPRNVDVVVSANNLGKTYGQADPDLTATVDGTIAGDKLNYTLSREDGEDTGTYPITVTLGENPNYVAAVQNGTFTITPKEIDVVVKNAKKIYGSDEPTYEASVEKGGLVGDDELTYEFSREEGENVRDGGYRVTAEVGQSEKSNYTIKEVKAGTLTINPKSVTVTAENKFKTYGQGDPAFTAVAEGLIAGDEGALSYTFNRTGSEQVNTEIGYPITITEVSQTGKNYDVTTKDGALKILPLTATIKANVASKTYGEADPTLTAVVDGTIGTDTLEYTLSRVEGADVKEGGYPIEVTLGTNPNYIVSKEDAVLTINKKAITVTADNKGKTYGDADPEKFTATVEKDALVGLDKLDYTVSREAGENVRDNGYAIQVTQGTNPNYEVKTVAGEFAINPRNVKVKAEDASKTYGNNDPAVLEAKVTEGKVLEGDSLNYSVHRVAGEDVKADGYAITVTESQNPNYNVTTEPGLFRINPRKVTLTPDNKTKIYGGEEPEYTAGVTKGNVIEGDTLDYTISRVAGTDAADYDINIVLGSNPNYEITPGTGRLTIAPKEVDVVVAANKAGKVYGADEPELTAEVKGVEENDTLNYTLARETGENVGTYPIKVTLGTNPNYKVAVQDANFVISKKDVTVTMADASKTYGEADPDFEAKAEGVIGDDKLDYTLEREAGENVRENGYVINAALGKNPNYTVKTVPGTMTIDRKAATITAEDASKVYGAADPGLTAKTKDTVGNDVLDYTINREENEEVGSYNIEVKAGENPNYKVEVAKGNFKIFGQVFYNANGGNGEVADEETYERDGNITVKGQSDIAHESATFLGWSQQQYDVITTQEEEDRAKTAIADTIAMGDKSVTLHAVWALDENGPEGTQDKVADYKEYTVTYDANGGAGTTIDANLYPTGHEYTVAENAFTNEGNVFDKWNEQADGSGTGYDAQKTLSIAGNTTLFAQWNQDVFGEGENPDEGDGIPDKYQVAVNFAAVNGTVDIENTVVTLKDAQGQPSEEGTGTLERVPTATAEEGYDQNSIEWTPIAPENGMEVTEETTITASFAEQNVEQAARTAGYTTPGTITPATIVETITEPLTALANAVGEVLNANVQELVAVDEEGVPLADKASGDHKCCVLHMLLLLLALGVELAYVRSAKKRQKRLFELEEEIALIDKELKEDTNKDKEGIA